MNYYEYGMKMVWSRRLDIFRRRLLSYSTLWVGVFSRVFCLSYVSVSPNPQSLHFIGGYSHSTPSELIAKKISPPLIPLVSQILSLKKENPAADTSALEREIDALVYELYGLTEAEIGVIEQISKNR